MKLQVQMFLVIFCILLQRLALGAPGDELRKLVEGRWVDTHQTGATLNITLTNLTISVGRTQEVWTFVSPTNWLQGLSRNGVTNHFGIAEGGACDKVIYVGQRRWYVNRERAGPANRSQPVRPETNSPSAEAGSGR
jgi:hypothetical protein